MTFGIQLYMYITPIAYPLSYLSHSKYRAWIALNPLAPVVELFRYALYGSGTFSTGSILYSVGFMVVSLFVGLLIFTQVERSFMDTV
jgi:lipopolysaccharide transport system permease protein